MIAPILLMPKLVELALKAGEVTMDFYRGTTEVSYKDDRSPVTDADEAAEKVIVERLRELAPSIPIVAEEAVAAGDTPDVSDAPFWLVDPLDGTKEFINKKGEFTVNIGLIEDRRPIMGVVYAPAIETLWWGALGHGATIRQNGTTRTIACRPVPEDGIVAVASRSHRDPETNEWLAQRGISETITAGSSLKFCKVAEGVADYYPRFGPTMEWDTGAGHAVLRAAGGDVVTVDGAPFLYGKSGYRNGGFIAYGSRVP